MALPLERVAGQFQLDLNAERRRAFLAECNQRLHAARQHQLVHVREVPGSASARLLSDKVDAILQSIYQWLVAESRLTPAEYERLSLVAQGGYGRAQLNPHSDIDLLLILPDHPKPAEQAFVKSYLYMLWDLSKVELGHATKKISEAVETIGQDLDSTTALLNLRLIAGNEDTVNELSRRVASVVRGSSRRWFIEAKLAETKNRREKFGSSIYLLEPNVKEGEGGLRDVHSLQWLAYVLLGDDSLETLFNRHVVSETELQAIVEAVDFLLNVRTCLHHAEGRKVDALSFDKQPLVAQQLRYESDAQLLAEEKMMKDYYLHARNIDRYSQKATRALTIRGRGVGGMFTAVRRRSIDKRYFAKGGELYQKEPLAEEFKSQPELVMECFRISAARQLAISDELKGSIEEARPSCNTEAFRRSARCREDFMQIMAQRRCAAQTVHVMHDTGVLADYMPEFKRLFCLVRIDHYHRYTVDEHLIKTLEISEEVTSAPEDARYELTEVARSIRRWDLLNLSLLLHDIGKGEGHGHVLRGAIISQNMTQRMGLPASDQETVRLLILYHLKMVHISQRRDLEDPHVIAEMAGTTPDLELLKMLYVLTYCDTRGVGPNAWTDWKGSLLYDLFRKTMLMLEGKNPLAPMDDAALERIRQKLLMALGETKAPESVDRFLANAPTKYLTSIPPARMARHYTMLQGLDESERIAWQVNEPEHINFTEITVVAQDVKGLLSWVCGALSSKDINILSLQAFSTKDGYAIDVFQVTDLRGNKLPHGFRMDRLRTDLNQVILKRKEFSEAFPLRKKRHALREDLAVLKPVQIILDNDGSPNYTILEVKAYDRPGLLYDVTSICSEQGYYIHLAMITTEAYRVVDVFYITDLEFTKLDGNRVKKLRDALELVVE
ncbi:MAG: [protein-PII] uridylyltransferase [Candidatus Sumerlaeaceae bacterium]